MSTRRHGARLVSRVRYVWCLFVRAVPYSDLLTRTFLQDLRESAAAAKSKKKISYDNLGESAKNKAKL